MTERPEPRTATLPKDASSTRRMRTYGLTVSAPGAPAQQVSFAQPLVRVGSASANELVLVDPYVSRQHFEISFDELGYRLRDCGSSNGTLVDGARATDVYLRPGARILAGRTQLRFDPLDEEAEIPQADRERFGPLLGKSAAMRELYAKLEAIAPTQNTVLIEGESGAGKELVARALHQASTRAQGPYVVFDCAAVSPQLVESELFGHVRGAFTGADAARPGCFQEASGGTLFLDELGELPRELQPKFLRALESREVRSVGSTKSVPVDVRVIAATNRNLAAEVNRGTFREDLFYRVAVARVRVPPLRERREDLPLLVTHLARELCGSEELDARLRALEPEWKLLEQHPWPGNVRELRNVVARALMSKDEPLVQSLDRPRTAAASAVTAPPSNQVLQLPLDLACPFVDAKAAALAQFEAAYLNGMLEACGGNISQAAAKAGLDRSYFKRLLRRGG